MWKYLVSILLGLTIAAVAAGLAGSAVQSHLNLSALQAANPDAVTITPALRWSVTLHDFLNFAPLFAVLAVFSFIPAFPVAALISRGLGGRLFWFSLAGFTGLTVALVVANQVAPMPAFIVATRTWQGLLAMSGSGLLGGLAFALVVRSKGSQGGLDHVVIR